MLQLTEIDGCPYSSTQYSSTQTRVAKMGKLQHIMSVVTEGLRVARKRYQENEERIAQERQEYQVAMEQFREEMKVKHEANLRRIAEFSHDENRRLAVLHAIKFPFEYRFQGEIRSTQPRRTSQKTQTDWSLLPWVIIGAAVSHYIQKHQTPPKTVHFKDTWNSNPHRHYRR
jgi:hypothetical protein